jgi:pimeloyl-ACP methyl ester carboxylesterase
MGWSDAGPLPRTVQQFATELHALLQQAKEPGPYVLVGHSMGGFTMRVFVHDYPSEVAGVVLIESMSPAQFAASTASTSTQTAQVSQTHASSVLPILARIGMIRLLARPLGLTPTSLPNEAAYTARYVRPGTWQTVADESQGMPDSARQAGAVKSFGDLPLLILSRKLGNSAADQVWHLNQKGLLLLSTRSRQSFADQSGHNVELDQPEAAVGAIVDMVKIVHSLRIEK